MAEQGEGHGLTIKHEAPQVDVRDSLHLEDADAAERQEQGNSNVRGSLTAHAAQLNLNEDWRRDSITLKGTAAQVLNAAGDKRAKELDKQGKERGPGSPGHYTTKQALGDRTNTRD